MRIPQRRAYAGRLCLPALLFLSAATLRAQQTTATLLDPDGDEIPTATVTLNTTPPTILHASPDGILILPSAAPVTLTITAPGFATRTLTLDELHPLPPVLTLQPSTADSVQVTASQHEIAEAELHVEEHQRLLGAIPNYYVVYDWNAPPISARQKYSLALKTFYDPVTIAISLGFAGIYQATNTLPGYGSGPTAFAKRFGAITADTAVGTIVGGALLPAVFHQDPRYFYMGHGTKTHRFLYALSTAVIAKGDNGHWQPSYSGLLGNLASGAASNLYYPPGNRNGLSTTFINAGIGAASDGVGNVNPGVPPETPDPQIPHLPNPLNPPVEIVVVSPASR